MIKEIRIKNFKSIQDLQLPLGRFNILIGSNGSGKSNVLEAIAFGGAASADKLDNEFLASRGIRTGASLMKSAFSKETLATPISLEFKNKSKSIHFTITEQGTPVPKWIVQEKQKLENQINDIIESIVNEKDETLEIPSDIRLNTLKSISYNLEKLSKEDERGFQNLFNNLTQASVKDSFFLNDLADFIIYNPQINSLRKFEGESQIKPLGIKGEGLFNLLQILGNDNSQSLEELKHFLHVIDWFDDFEIGSDKITGRKNIAIKDRHIENALLNEYNVNEGFLFLLFFIALFLSPDTPRFFAIDNVEASFHPRLCEDLMKNLVQLSKRHNKQVIITTQNPFVLDGLDLADPEQCLFVIRRNSEGETIADSITNIPQNIKLSESWMRGYIGGQPETIGS